MKRQVSRESGRSSNEASRLDAASRPISFQSGGHTPLRQVSNESEQSTWHDETALSPEHVDIVLGQLSALKKEASLQDSQPVMSATRTLSSRSFMVSKDQAEHIKICESHRVFLPGSRFLGFWDIFMFCVLVVTGVMEPYVLVFGTHDVLLIETKGSIGYVFFYWLSTLAFATDMGLRFFRAQKKSTRDGVILVTHLPELARRYVGTSRFIVDVMSALPLTFFAQLIGISSKRKRVIGLLRMVRLVKFTNLHGTYTKIQDVTGWPFNAINIFQFAMMSLLVLHWIACLWASLVWYTDKSWFHTSCDKYNFLECGKHWFSESSGDMYLMSLYWSVTVLSSVGFGDIVPQVRLEFAWAIFCMCLGGTVWAYIVGSVCGLSASLDKLQDAFKNLVTDVNVLCIERHVPNQLKDRVEDFYSHAKEFMRMQSYHHTIRDLSPVLKGEVVSWMYGSCFKRVWYFDVVDERCARLLSEGMVPKMYGPEECIEDSLSGVRCLVFLRSGLCVRKKNLLAPGACWGLDVILGSEEHQDIEQLLDTEQAVSLNFCFVLKLCKNTIDHAASLMPDFARRLRKAHMRMLFWRGAIAASRALSRLDEPEVIEHTTTPVWDRAGKMMAQVVHQDCQLIHQYEEKSATQSTRLHDQLVANHEDHASVSTNRTHHRRAINFSSPFHSPASFLDRSSSFHLERRKSTSSQASAFSRGNEPLVARDGRRRRTHSAVANAAHEHTPPESRTQRLASSDTSPQGDAPQRSSRCGIDGDEQDDRQGKQITPDEKDVHMSRQISATSKASSAGMERQPSKDSSFSDEPLSAWKATIHEKLDDVHEEMTCINEGIMEDVGCLREEVGELSRLMKTLLVRLDADEKY